jgi:hypothetical protein
MKKFILYCFISLTAFSAKAQFIDAIGLAGGITYGIHDWFPSEFNTQERYLLGLNGAGFAEFFHYEMIRWRVELEYNQMGSKELVYSYYTNRTTYLTLNNYLKIQFRMLHIIPYILVGPRVEYLLINSPQKYGDVIGAFPKFFFTVAIGGGVELNTKSLFRPFIEGFYNRDLLPSYHSAMYTIYYHGFEARIGFRYVFDNSGKKAACPKVINPMGN